MSTIRQIQSEEDIEHVRELFLEYLHWANEGLNAEYGIDFDVVSMVEEDMAHQEIFSPPDGRLLLALEGKEAAGLACMRRIRMDIGEIKRMYVRPEFRGKGIDRQLVDSLIQEARTIGYPRLRLDSTRFMVEAHALSLRRLQGDRRVSGERDSRRILCALGLYGDETLGPA